MKTLILCTLVSTVLGITPTVRADRPSQPDIDAQMANFNKQINEARSIPVMRNGEVVGYKLANPLPQKGYEKAGFKTGDVITAVNGEKVTDENTSTKSTDTKASE